MYYSTAYNHSACLYYSHELFNTNSPDKEITFEIYSSGSLFSESMNSFYLWCFTFGLSEVGYDYAHYVSPYIGSPITHHEFIEITFVAHAFVLNHSQLYTSSLTSKISIHHG